VLSYVERPAPADLADVIECVWTVRDPHAAARTPERIVPDGCPELIVHLGDRFARLDVEGRWVRQPRAFVAGTLTRPWMLRAGRRVDTVGIRFRPGALPSVLGGTLDGGADRELPLGRAETRELVDSLGATARLRAAERWVRGRRGAPPASAEAVSRILAARGQVRIDAVARAVGWGRRRLERVFAHELGIAPKLFARIVRLNAVLASLDGGERARAVDLALAAGYFDEAHMLGDFRRLAGRGPRARREADGELARHFTRPERLRALLSHFSNPRGRRDGIIGP